MIEAPTRFNRQRSHQTGSRSELIRRLEMSTSARRWTIRGVAPIALPPGHLQHNDRKKEKKFCQSFCVILLLMYSQGKPGEKIRREKRSAWFKNISSFVVPARTISRMSRCGCPSATSSCLPVYLVRGSPPWCLSTLPTKHNDYCSRILACSFVTCCRAILNQTPMRLRT